MTIGILDPALFVPRSGVNPDHRLKQEIDTVLVACSRYGIRLVCIEPYWRRLWQEFGRPPERSLRLPEARRAVQELRKAGEPFRGPPSGAGPVRYWPKGFKDLFSPSDSFRIGEDWLNLMVHAAAAAVMTGEETVVLVRLLPGRNLQQHVAEDTTLDEITRWVLYLQPQGFGARQVLCVYHYRNLAARWTARFDYRLPAEMDGARYPFCPPDHWWKGATRAFKTAGSKPAWVDRHGNTWARPNIPGGRGYHWDVNVRMPGMADRLGLDQINVVAWGAPAVEKPVGEIHHVPTKKQARLKDDPGWSC